MDENPQRVPTHGGSVSLKEGILTPAPEGWPVRTLWSEMAVTEGRTRCDFTHRRSLEELDSGRREEGGGARGWGSRGELLPNGDSFSLKDREFWRWMVAMAAQQCECI